VTSVGARDVTDHAPDTRHQRYHSLRRMRTLRFPSDAMQATQRNVLFEATDAEDAGKVRKHVRNERTERIKLRNTRQRRSYRK